MSGGLGGGSTDTYGATATYTCNTNFTKSGSAPTCQANGSWSAAPTCAPSQPVYCDVVYHFYNGSSGLARFHNIFTGTGAQNVQYAVGVNATTAGGLPSPTPFTHAAFPGGYMRLRFPANGAGTAPVAGTVQLIEYYFPAEFSASASGTTLSTDLDFSAGLLGYTASGCTGGQNQCLSSPVALSRTCSPVATGTVAGTTLTFGTCSVPNYPGAYTASSGTPSNAQLTWALALSQVISLSSNPGCLANLSAYGNVTCSGSYCNLLPAGLIGVLNGTWDQPLGNFTFSSSAYGSATVTVPEFIVPVSAQSAKSADLYSGPSVPASAAASSVQCGTLSQLVCNSM